ncbi:hypothetical protein [Parasphingopyxis sp.]|uniref:hypothetical protein n=1 Tax=Parasphingopyxis sp. TaxID=1920299 RepID=UPI0026120314|nr:hypothetical protein [Parasphingopyxis sp.]
MIRYFLLGLGLAVAAVGHTKAVAQEDTDATAPIVSFVGAWEGEMQSPRWVTYLHLSLALDGTETGTLRAVGQTFDLGDPQIEGSTLTVSLVGPWSITPRIHLRRDGENLVGEWQEEDRRYPLRVDAVPDYPEPTDRVAAWSQDIDALQNRFLRLDRSFSPASRQLFLERTTAIREQLSVLSDDEVLFQLAQAVGLSGNPHTRLYLLRRHTRLSRLPIRVWWFGGELRVIGSDENHAGLLGCRVDTISGLEVRQARDIVGTAFAGNPSWVDYKSPYYLTSPEALRGLGITPADARVELRLADCAAPQSVQLDPLPLQRSRDLVEAWWDLLPERTVAGGWRHVLADQAGGGPLYLSRSDTHYWHDRLADHGIFYLSLSRTEPMEEQSINDFAEDALAALRASDARALVVDLRFNTGGNGGLVEDLMETLDAETADIPRYVITGRATFSAGILIAARWRATGRAIIVGEPVGDDIDYWAEGGGVFLPNSDIEAHFANGAHNYSPGPCPTEEYCLDIDIEGLRPDVPAHLGWTDYLEGRDPALDAIVRHMASSPD